MGYQTRWAALILLARETHIVVALIVPLYYILDAGTTIVMRLSQGENILKAHSKHAYQTAKRSGWSVLLRGRGHLEYGPPQGEAEPEVWLSGPRSLRLRISVTEVTGRRLTTAG